MPQKKTSVNFENTLHELEGLVEKMEQGNLSLEESLQCFERGIILTKTCQKILSEAEQKIRVLSGKESKTNLEPFNSKNNNT